jgi:hypothetical protein
VSCGGDKLVFLWDVVSARTVSRVLHWIMATSLMLGPSLILGVDEAV